MPPISVVVSLRLQRPLPPRANEPTEANPPPQLEQLTCWVAPSRIELSTRLVIIWDCCALATLLIEFVMPPTVAVGEERRKKELSVSSSVYLKPPAIGVLASAKASGETEPPFFARTSGMPLPDVCPPRPPTLLIVSRVEPVAFPPLMIIWSPAEPDPLSATFMVMFAPFPA